MISPISDEKFCAADYAPYGARKNDKGLLTAYYSTHEKDKDER